MSIISSDFYTLKNTHVKTVSVELSFSTSNVKYLVPRRVVLMDRRLLFSSLMSSFSVDPSSALFSLILLFLKRPAG